ncbi:MAG TPA: TetR family transcriptional regulator [Rugosimonospora sp.]|nr:TetR family transcriptional regulator [Rugosimonospora sp.]
MPDPTPVPARSLAERKRDLVRDELADAALRLLAAQGFEQTTVEQIVAAAGVSRRTFFRYYQSKEDVVVQVLTAAGEEMCAELRARPAAEPVAVALRHALTGFIAKAVEHPGKTRQITRLMLETPTLLARFLERQAALQADMAGSLGRRSGLDPGTDLRPALTAGVALAAFQTALRRWAYAEPGGDLADLVDQAFAMVAPVLDGADGPGQPRDR